MRLTEIEWYFFSRCYGKDFFLKAGSTRQVQCPLKSQAFQLSPRVTFTHYDATRIRGAVAEWDEAWVMELVSVWRSVLQWGWPWQLESV
jgi:hypothetical protein